MRNPSSFLGINNTMVYPAESSRNNRSVKLRSTTTTTTENIIQGSLSNKVIAGHLLSPLTSLELSSCHHLLNSITPNFSANNSLKRFSFNSEATSTVTSQERVSSVMTSSLTSASSKDYGDDVRKGVPLSIHRNTKSYGRQSSRSSSSSCPPSSTRYSSPILISLFFLACLLSSSLAAVTEIPSSSSSSGNELTVELPAKNEVTNELTSKEESPSPREVPTSARSESGNELPLRSEPPTTDSLSPTRSGRPFYNIAHMVNSIKEVNYYLSRGANAIEADVAFSPNGSALYTFHGYPCDCFRHCTEREDIAKYLEYVREVTRPDSPYFKRQLSLLFLDLKISGLPPSAKAVAGQDMAAKVIQHLFEDGKSDTRVHLLMSIGHIYDSDFILGFQNELESRDLAQNLSGRIGWDVGLNDPVSSIVSMWRRIEVIENIWQGDGRSNCISPFYNLGRLTKVIERRDERNDMIDDPYIDKVYHWTIDLSHNLRASLRWVYIKKGLRRKKL